MVLIRKFLEQTNRKTSFKHLTAHCTWALHVDLESSASAILRDLDEGLLHRESSLSNAQLRERGEMFSLPRFRSDLSAFLVENNIPDFCENLLTWAPFLKLYVKVISECPLIFTADPSFKKIERVTMRFFELPIGPSTEYDYFAYRWDVQLRDGSTQFFSTSWTFTKST